MPGQGKYRWQFVGKEPVSFLVVVALFFVNIILSLGQGFIVKHLIPNAVANCRDCPALADSGIRYCVPEFVCWYAKWSLAIQFVILGLGALIMLIYRKDVRRVR
jgi:hypothetical protein